MFDYAGSGYFEGGGEVTDEEAQYFEDIKPLLLSPNTDNIQMGAIMLQNIFGELTDNCFESKYPPHRIYTEDQRYLRSGIFKTPKTEACGHTFLTIIHYGWTDEDRREYLHEHFFFMFDKRNGFRPRYVQPKQQDFDPILQDTINRIWRWILDDLPF